jgi:hypothetical protein
VRREGSGGIAPLTQTFESGVIAGVTVHAAKRTALFFNPRQSAQSFLACAGRTLEGFRLGRTDQVAFLFEQLLQLGQENDFLTQQFRQVLAAQRRVHRRLFLVRGRLAVRDASQSLLHLEELRGDVLGLHGVRALLNRRLQGCNAS